ncbi:MAG TPA: hypothetical protein VEX36_08045 [Thermoleophilaceae bacterium]|nr:hypothetical protein [Thermoleophilaceae bacterium]
MRRLTALAIVAIAIAAAVAPSAFAQGTEPLAVAPHDLQVRSEPSGVLCPAVTPATPPATGNFTTAGGCLIHVAGSGIVQSGHVFGVETIESTCNIEFDLRIGGDGAGYLTHVELVPGIAGTCERRPCHYPNTPNPTFVPPSTVNGNHNEARPHRGYMEETTNPVGERLVFLFCLEPRSSTSLEPMTKRHCQVAVPFTETANHRYTFTANDVGGTGTPRCELNGTYVVEPTQLQGPGSTEATRSHLEINHI